MKVATRFNADLLDNQHVDDIMGVGDIKMSATLVTPPKFLLCDGSQLNRVTYSTLHNAITQNKGKCTISIAAPAVVTLSNHGFVNGARIEFTTTDTLPTGITPYTNYYTNITNANRFITSIRYVNISVFYENKINMTDSSYASKN